MIFVASKLEGDAFIFQQLELVIYLLHLRWFVMFDNVLDILRCHLFEHWIWQ